MATGTIIFFHNWNRRCRLRICYFRTGTYPEDRGCRAPTATRALAIFSGLARHRLLNGDHLAQVFPPQLSALQRQVLDLLGVPETTYTA